MWSPPWCRIVSPLLQTNKQEKWKKIIQFGKTWWTNMPFHYIVPSPSTALPIIAIFVKILCRCMANNVSFIRFFNHWFVPKGLCHIGTTESNKESFGQLEHFFGCVILYSNKSSLTPYRPLRQTSFTYPKLNLDGFTVLNASLAYEDSTQEVKYNFLHAGIGKMEGEGSGIMHITYINIILCLLQYI